MKILSLKYASIFQNFQPDIMVGDELDTLSNFKRDPEVGAVVVGFDKHFSYPKLVKAATYAHDPEIHFIGTNPDVERPSPYESKYPGEYQVFKIIPELFPILTLKKIKIVSKFQGLAAFYAQSKLFRTEKL